MPLVKSAFRVSLVSVAWTLTVGSVAIVAGAIGSSLALVTFGSIGLLVGDGVGLFTPAHNLAIIEWCATITNRGRWWCV